MKNSSHGNKIKKDGIGFKAVMWIILAFFLLYTLVPMIWLLIASLKTNVELVTSPFSIPKNPQWGNYVNAFKVSGLGRLFLNSIIVSFSATALNVLVASMISFPLSRFKFKGREAIFTMFVVGVLVPINSLMVPYFKIISGLHIYDTLFALILTYTAIGLPISVSIIRGFMISIPAELEEAGIIDGCNFFQRFFKIVFPMSKTGIVTAATFQFLLCWNEFLYAMLLTSSEKNRTIQLGIRYFSNQFTTDYVSMYAAIVVSIVPSIIGYILLQDKIVSGLTNGAVKG